VTKFASIRLLKIVGSALLLTLAFPPFDMAPLVLVALAPLLSVLISCDPKRAWRSGYLFGFMFALGQLHWLAQLAQKWTGSFGLALVPWLLATLAMACYFGLFGYLANRCATQGRFWMIPLLWAGIEVFRTYIPVLAFPWALAATPLWRFPPIIQGASFGTIYLVSAWVVAVNLVVALVAQARKLAGPGIGIAIGVFAFVAFSVCIFLVPRSTETLPITLGQVGIDMAFETPDAINSQIPGIVQNFEASAQADDSRLLVLSEGIAEGKSDDSFFSFRLKPKPPILFGAQREADPETYFQSAIGFDGQWHHADKTRLVIFGEFVPGRNVLPFLSAFNLPGGDLSAGKTGVRAMDLGGLRVGPLLCFEGLFPDLSYRQALNGSEVIAVMSNDDWFMNSSAPEQLRAASIWRSVETGIPVVRVGSLGYSLASDSKGNLVASLPLKKSMASTVPVNTAKANPWFLILPLFPVVSLVFCGIAFLPLREKPAG
jgi:apolipoprotein N-acyltransferase